MRIIKRRSLPTSKEFTCKHCFSELEVEKDDLRYEGSPKPNDDNYSFICAVCQYRNFVDAALIPQGMR